MKKYYCLFLILITTGIAQSQDRYFTKSGNIRFFSKTPLEDIDAVNKTASCVLDIKTGALQFAVMIKAFEFKKALMQEHFNENYLESDTYQQSVFKGEIINNKEVNYSKPGSYPVKVKGLLTIHGQTKTVETNGTLEVKKGNIQLQSVFPVLLSDYKIKNDKVSNIASSIRITVDVLLAPLIK